MEFLSPSFRSFARSYGVRTLARDLGVTRSAVYGWMEGRSAPRIEHALTIIEISDGRLRITDVPGIEHRLREFRERVGHADQR